MPIPPIVQLLVTRHQALRLRFAAENGGLGARLLAAVLEQWGPKTAVPTGFSGAFMQCVSGALSGALGPAFLRNMHRIFRCVEQVDPGPTTPPFRLDIQDVSHLSEGPAKAAAIASAIETATRRFDMKTQGWLFRATLVRIAADEHRFVLAWSHMISDGIAAAAFYRELVATYAHGAAVVLPKVASYGEYVQWEAEHLAAGAGKAELAFWAGLLGRDPEQLRLAGTPPRPRATAALPCRAGRVDFAIDAATRSSLEGVARAHGATLHMAALASFHALLHQRSGQRRIIVGTLVARRPLPEHHGMMGHVADVVPIVVDFRPRLGRQKIMPAPPEAAEKRDTCTVGLSYFDVLAEVRERVLQGLENQSVVFSMICAEVLSAPDFAKSALMQAYFNFLQPGTNASPGALRLGKCEGEYDLPMSWAREGHVALTPLAMTLRLQHDGSLRGRLVYQADVFDAVMMEALVQHYCLIVKSACKMLPAAPLVQQ
eukprot:SM000160S02548  [mRNA]  locus=s160:232327:234762:+ [translate_table: standard]